MSASNNNVLVKQLIEFGLSEKEAKIYLALLELEVATVTEVAETAGINRSSTYVVMEALKKKGLVSTSEDKKIQTYSAVSPEMLLEDAKNKAKRADAIKNNINDIVPELKALHKEKYNLNSIFEKYNKRFAFLNILFKLIFFLRKKFRFFYLKKIGKHFCD